MNDIDEPPCSACGLGMLAWQGAYICGVCDNPPLHEGTWFQNWRGAEPA